MLNKYKYLIIILIVIQISLLIPKSSIVEANNKDYTITNSSEQIKKGISPKYKEANDTEPKSENKLIINRINLNEELFDLKDKRNNINEHVTILEPSIMPDKSNSIVIIAAHSGTGKIAYFERLDELKIDDKITLIYKNKKYNYYVKDIWEENKNGYINVSKGKENQLILTTCSPNKQKKQLIINCIEKDS